MIKPLKKQPDFSLNWGNTKFRESVRRKSQVVYCCAAVMLFCRVAVHFKTAALQQGPLFLTHFIQELEIPLHDFLRIQAQ